MDKAVRSELREVNSRYFIVKRNASSETRKLREP